MTFLSGPNLGTLIFAIVALPFAIIALVLMVMMLRSSRKAHASEHWPVTSGRILDSHVGSHRSLDSNGMHTTLYEPFVQYEYVVNGQHFQSKNVSFGMVAGASFPGMAEAVVAKYPTGSLVQVSYNPARPDEAVLEHSAGSSNRVLTCVVALIVGILLISGVFMFFMQGFVAQIMKLVPHF